MKRLNKARIARAKLLVVAARDRAIETAQQHAVPSMKRPPTVFTETALGWEVGEREVLTGRTAGRVTCPSSIATRTLGTGSLSRLSQALAVAFCGLSMGWGYWSRRAAPGTSFVVLRWLVSPTRHCARRRWQRDRSRSRLWSNQGGAMSMAPLSFTCPKTFKHAPTGIEIDVQSLCAVWRATLTVHCPHCGKLHEMFVREV